MRLNQQVIKPVLIKCKKNVPRVNLDRLKNDASRKICTDDNFCDSPSSNNTITIVESSEVLKSGSEIVEDQKDEKIDSVSEISEEMKKKPDCPANLFSQDEKVVKVPAVSPVFFTKLIKLKSSTSTFIIFF